MNKIIKTLILILISQFALAQNTQTQQFIKKAIIDTIYLNYNFYLINLNKYFSVYSLAQYFGTSVDNIIYYTLKYHQKKIDLTKSRIPLPSPLLVPEKKFEVDLKPFVLDTNYFIVKDKPQNICRRYNISCQTLKQLNNLKKLPTRKTKLKVYLVKEKNFPDLYDSLFIYHILFKGESLTLISQLYNVPLSELLQYNPQNPKTYSFIIIPRHKFTDKEKQYLDLNKIQLPDWIEILNQSVSEEHKTKNCLQIAKNKNLAIIYLFPFNADLNLSSLQNYPYKKRKFNPTESTKKYYDFLFGSLIAIKNSYNLNFIQNSKIYILDQYHLKPQQLKQIIDNSSLTLLFTTKQNLNVLDSIYLQNFYPTNLFITLPFEKDHSILINRPYLIIFNPSQDALYDKIGHYISATFDTSNVLFVSDYSIKTSDAIDKIKKAFYKYYLTGILDTPTISTLPYDMTKPDEQLISSTLDPNKTNILIAPVDNEIFVTSLLNYLNAFKGVYNYKISIVGLPNWENYRNIDFNWFLNLNIVYPSAYILTNSPEIMQMTKLYTQTFANWTSFFSLYAYDITTYLINLYNYALTEQQLCNINLPFMQKGIFFAKFQFNRYLNSWINGFENSGVVIIKYNKQNQGRLEIIEF